MADLPQREHERDRRAYDQGNGNTLPFRGLANDKGYSTNPGDYYFSPWEPGANEYKNPLPAADLRKFASTTCAHLIYASGAIQIFDVTQIENGSCVPGTVGAARGASR